LVPLRDMDFTPENMLKPGSLDEPLFFVEDFTSAEAAAAAISSNGRWHEVQATAAAAPPPETAKDRTTASGWRRRRTRWDQERRMIDRLGQCWAVLSVFG